MATVSTTCKGTYGSHYTLYLQYTLNSQSVANNTSNITVHMYAKADSTSYQAHNSNATNPVTIKVGGSTKVSKKIAMDFRNKKTVDMGTWTGNVTHGSDGKLTIKLEGSFTINGVSSLSGGSISKSWTLTDIPRKSTVSCADGNIGSSTTIVIDRKSSSFTHTIWYKFKTDSDNTYTQIGSAKRTDTTIGWTIPTSLYAKITTAKTGKVTIKCETFNGSTSIGTNTCDATVTVTNSLPTVSATVVDCNQDTIAKTGDANTLIKYCSTAQIDITATGQNSATISSVKAVCGTQERTTASSTIQNVESGIFTISATDSRGYSNNIQVEKTIVDYIKVAITSITLERLNTTSDTVKLDLSGNYFADTFGENVNAVSNSLTLKFRAKEEDGSYGSYTTLTPTIDTQTNTFTFSNNLSGTYDFKKQYVFEIVASDLLLTNSWEVVVARGIPLLDIGKDDIIVNGETRSNFSDIGFIHENGASIGFGVGEGQVNRGIHDLANSFWVLYRDSTNTYLQSNGSRIYFRPNASSSGQSWIESNGALHLGYNGLYSDNNMGIRLDQYGNIILQNYNSSNSNSWSVNDPNSSSVFTIGFNSGSVTIEKGILYINGETIRCKPIYDSNNVTNAANLYVTSNGYFRRTTNTSSERYKKQIKPLENEELNPERLYNLEVKQFKYKEKYQPDEKDGRYDKTLIGFIAEELEKLYPIAIDYTEDGQIDNWNERYMIPAMLKLIQNQKKEIDNLKERLDNLEKGK